jgi:hypothetical protein
MTRGPWSIRSTAAFSFIATAFAMLAAVSGCDQKKQTKESPRAVDIARCERAVVARVTAQEELRALARKLGRDPENPHPHAMAPSGIFIFWMVELGDAHPDAASLVYPVFFVDPRTGAVTARDGLDANPRMIDDDPARGRPVVEACVAR